MHLPLLISCQSWLTKFIPVREPACEFIDRLKRPQIRLYQAWIGAFKFYFSICVISLSIGTLCLSLSEIAYFHQNLQIVLVQLICHTLLLDLNGHIFHLFLTGILVRHVIIYFVLNCIVLVRHVTLLLSVGQRSQLIFEKPGPIQTLARHLPRDGRSQNRRTGRFLYETCRSFCLCR